jgi:predicted GNAT family acetyltransferase
MMPEAFNVVNNEAAQRYEVIANGMIAISEYELGEGEIVFTHTEVPVALEGRGIGSALARAALADARARSLTVVPRCPFIREYVRRHPEYLDLMDERSSDAIQSTT